MKLLSRESNGGFTGAWSTGDGSAGAAATRSGATCGDAPSRVLQHVILPIYGT